MAYPAIVKTERLILRVPLPEDAPQIAQSIGRKEVVWNLGRAPFPYALSDANAWIERTPEQWMTDRAYSFVITLPETGVIGAVGVDHLADQVWEIGYWVGAPWWGLGYATEAAAAVLEWAQAKHGLRAFVSGHFVDNPASGNVLTKLGFEPVGEIQLPSLARGEKSRALRYVRGAKPEQALGMAIH